MTWAEKLNSCSMGQKLSNSMQNIKLDTNISPAEIQAKIAAHCPNLAAQKDNTSPENMSDLQPAQGVQTQPQPALSAQIPQMQTQPIQYQPYQYQIPQMQTQPIQYQAYQYQVPQPIQTTAPVTAQQPVPVSYQTAPQYQQLPQAYSLPNTSAANAPSAYTNQAQPQAQAGGQLNVMTQE